MKTYKILSKMYAIGIILNAGDTVTVHNRQSWSCSLFDYPLVGDFLSNVDLKEIEFLSDGFPMSVICKKVKVMYKRQPYYKKLKGITEDKKFYYSISV